jgi:hypothetical protein
VGACSPGKLALSVDLRTDYVPGREFVNIVTEVTPDGEGAQSSSRAASEGKGDYLTGERVADFGDLPQGSFQVRVRVFSGENEMLVERLARVSVTGDYALTMVVTRNCEGVVCPEPAGDPGKITCNGGKCVQPECLPEHPELCPAPDCTGDADCHADAPCVAARCFAGTCLFVPNDGLCKGGQSCDVTRGCFAPGGEDCKATSATETNCGDGLDEDCDGKVDCLDPDCDAKACEDGDQCTEGEVCQKSACGGGTAVECDDDNSCTTDSCDHTSGCQHAPLAAGACDDGNECTAGDHCAAGACVPGAASGCDDKNPCTDDTCDKDGCQHTPNTLPCDDGNACTTGDRCTQGMCKAGPATSCDDKNPCTDDSCDPKTGCTTKPKASGPCDDGVFCNGADTCAGGACQVHAGQPCGQVCDEANKQCVGCLVDSDCGPTSQSPWSDCGGFASPCATDGMQTSTITSPMCVAGVCKNNVTTATQACVRATEGTACGDVALGSWSACDYGDVCELAASRSRQVTTPTCMAGACNQAVTQETEACSRQTNGVTCKATVTGAWSACGSFATQCDTTGSKTHQITTYTCESGACTAAKTSASASCTRTVSNGTGCGSGKYCCSGSCFAKNDPNHCSSCGISCGGGGKCVATGSHYSCTCGSNSQCVGDGFGPGATCWSASGGPTLCNCQCTGNNCCSGGADCYQPSGQNYCSY